MSWARALLAGLVLTSCTALTRAIPFLAPDAGWTKLATGLDAQDTFSFTALALDTHRQVMIATGWSYQPWCFDLATDQWTACMTRGPRNDFHNAGYAYDPVNDRYWVSGGSAGTGTEYWQRGTGARVIHFPAPIGMDPAMLYDPPRKRFIAFGGWSEPPSPRVHTLGLDPPAASWTTKTLTSGPDWNWLGDAAKMTFTRSGWDLKRSKIWYVHPDGVLWWLDPVALVWTSEPTSGTKPEEYAVFGRHETADALVAWVGENYIASAGYPKVRKTYLLELATKVWHELPTAQVPPGSPSADSMMLWDPGRARLLMHTGPNYTRETWVLTLGTTPPPVTGPNPVTTVAVQTSTEPPPTQTYPLTLGMAGTGSGATSGGGDYAQGAAVTLTATPTADSQFSGWAPTPCAPSFAMPGAALTCTASFTKLPIPPVTGACLPTAPKTFTACAVPTDIDQSPFGQDSKDLMWTWDSTRKRLYIGLGDSASTFANQSGNTVLWSYDASTNGWAVVSTYCQATGSASPNFPSDYGVTVYDRGRDRVWWLGQGDGFPPGQEGQPCNQGRPEWPKGSVRRNGFLWLTPGTNTWVKTSEQATISTGGAYFDTQGDRVLSIEYDGGRLQAFQMEPMPAVKTTLANFEVVQPAPKWTGTAGGWGWAEYANRVKWAWDDAGRIAYVPLVFRRFDVAGAVVESGVWMTTVNTVTGTLLLKARAPLPTGFWPDPYMVMTVFDATNKKVIYPVINGSCGQIVKMLVYDPPTDTWEETPVPPGTHGATIAYDPERNVVLLGGRVFCEGVQPPPLATRLWLWRYAP